MSFAFVFFVLSIIHKFHKSKLKVETVKKLKVYDLLGREATTLVDEYKAAGNYKIKSEGTNLPSGVYFYTLTAGNLLQQRN
ncbi:MAG: T9SS type A sorting domain-containing protein [Bacteroidota bacterium]